MASYCMAHEPGWIRDCHYLLSFLLMRYETKDQDGTWRTMMRLNVHDEKKEYEERLELHITSIIYIFFQSTICDQNIIHITRESHSSLFSHTLHSLPAHLLPRARLLRETVGNRGILVALVVIAIALGRHNLNLIAASLRLVIAVGATRAAARLSSSRTVLADIALALGKTAGDISVLVALVVVAVRLGRNDLDLVAAGLCLVVAAGAAGAAAGGGLARAVGAHVALAGEHAADARVLVALIVVAVGLGRDDLDLVAARLGVLVAGGAAGTTAGGGLSGAAAAGGGETGGEEGREGDDGGLGEEHDCCLVVE